MNPRCLGCGKIIVTDKAIYRCKCGTVNTVRAMTDMRKLRESGKPGKELKHV
ncbi:MAG: hypothetical protein ABRQ38_08410 [Candidatus Eremiobacterota bacterium]